MAVEAVDTTSSKNATGRPEYSEAHEGRKYFPETFEARSARDHKACRFLKNGVLTKRTSGSPAFLANVSARRAVWSYHRNSVLETGDGG